MIWRIFPSCKIVKKLSLGLLLYYSPFIKRDSPVCVWTPRYSRCSCYPGSLAVKRNLPTSLISIGLIVIYKKIELQSWCIIHTYKHYATKIQEKNKSVSWKNASLAYPLNTNSWTLLQYTIAWALCLSTQQYSSWGYQTSRELFPWGH